MKLIETLFRVTDAFGYPRLSLQGREGGPAFHFSLLKRQAGLAMDSPVSPFRAIDVLSSDDERAIPESESWERVETDFENGDHLPPLPDGFDDFEMRDASFDGANLSAPVPIQESVEFTSDAASSTVGSVEWN